MTTAPQQSAIRVAKLGYVGFETPDVSRLVEYYTRVLDFVLVDGDERGAFLTTGTDHHCVVVTRGGHDADRSAHPALLESVTVRADARPC